MGFDKNKKEADVQNAQKKGKIGLIVGAFLLAAVSFFSGSLALWF